MFAIQELSSLIVTLAITAVLLALELVQPVLAAMVQLLDIWIQLHQNAYAIKAIMMIQTISSVLLVIIPALPVQLVHHALAAL